MIRLFLLILLKKKEKNLSKFIPSIFLIKKSLSAISKKIKISCFSFIKINLIKRWIISVYYNLPLFQKNPVEEMKKEKEKCKKKDYGTVS